MVSLTVSKSVADYVTCIIVAVIAALTYFLNAGAIISTPVFIACLIVFLNSIVDVNGNKAKITTSEAA